MQRPLPIDPVCSPTRSTADLPAVLEEMRRIAREELEISRELRPEDLLSDFELDSMALMVLAVGLEDRFRVTLSEGDSAAVRTVGDLAALVARRSAEENQ